MAPQVRNFKENCKKHDISTIIAALGRDALGVKRNVTVAEIRDEYGGLAQKNQYHPLKSILWVWANYSSLTLFASLDTQDTLWGGMIVE